MFRRPTALVALLALTCAAGAHAALQRPASPDDAPAVTWRLPMVVAPLIETAPTIDGTVDRREWSQAARLAPLIAQDGGLAAADPAWVLVAWTPDALHLAFQFHRPPYALEPRSQDNPLAVWGDDCLELLLAPEPGAAWDYSFVGNAAGVHEEGLRRTTTDKGWACEWSYAARLTEWGWEGELSIPFAGLDAPAPDEGTIWALAPVRNRKTPRMDLANWSFLKDWMAREDFGYLVFGGPVPAVRVLEAGEISRSEVGLILEVANFADEDATVQVSASLHRPNDPASDWFQVADAAADPLGAQAEGAAQVPADEVAQTALGQYTELAKTDETLTVPARQTRRIVFAHPAERSAYLLHYQVTDAASGRLLAGGPLPFFRRDPLEIAITPYILSAGVVEVLADYAKVPTVADGDRLALRILDATGARVLRETALAADVAAGRSAADLPVQGLEPGVYVARVSLSGADGTEKAVRDEVFDLPPIPEWWGNPYGHPEVADAVPEPWTPMRRTADGFAVWNREVALGELLQPARIANGETSMLAAPAKLDLGIAGLSAGTPELVEEKRTRMVWRVPLSAPGLTGELTLAAEFDGFMKYTLRLVPAGAATVDRLALRVPLRGALAGYYRHGYLGTLANATGRYDYGSLPAEGLSLPFTQTLWLGTDALGLEIDAETDRWWAPADEKRVVAVTPEGDAAVIAYELIGGATTISEPVSFEWALLPTPVKPLNHELLHRLNFAQGGFSLNEERTGLAEGTAEYIDGLLEAGVNAYNQWAWAQNPLSVWNEDFGAPALRPTPLNEVRKRVFREAVDLSHQKGLRWVVAYAIWNCFADWPGVGSLWTEQAQQPLRPTFNGYYYCPDRPFADWYIDQLRQTVLDIDIDGVYLDSSADPGSCIQAHHGHGYIDAQGRQHVAYPIFDARELHKRIYCLFHADPKTGGLVYAHNSHFPLMCVESFVDVHHCGEGSTLSREIAIPKFYGRPFGLPVSFTRWNNPIYPEKRMNSWRFVLQMDATIKAHPSFVISRDVLPDYEGMTRESYLARGYSADGEAVWQIWQAYRDFPWEGSQWIPSWEIEPWVRTGDPDLWACAHVQPGQAALVTVSSFREDTVTADVAIDWARMGLDPERVAVTDVITFEDVPHTAGGVQLEVGGKLFRMISIRAAQ